MRRAGLVFLLCAALLAGCEQTPTAENETPIPTTVETPEPVQMEPWQTAYIQLLQNEEREAREQARGEEMGYSNWEGYYILYDVDKDETPELLILSWELSVFFASLYTCPNETPTLVNGYFYCGRLPNFYSCPNENGILNDAARADPHGETHWWRKFSLVDGVLETEELLDEFSEWEGEGAFTVPAQDFAQATDLVADAQVLDWNGMTVDGKGEEPNLQPILDYTGLF